MANGASHNTATVISTFMIGGFAYAKTLDIGLAGWAALGSAATLLVNPDLDLEISTRNERRLMRRLPVIGHVWVWAWWPYAKLFRHRGMSHTPVIGTLTRLVYLAAMVSVALGLSGLRVDWMSLWPAAGYTVVGMALSDVAHWVMDR